MSRDAYRFRTEEWERTNKLSSQRTICFFLGIFSLLCIEALAAVTCEECQERDKQRALIQQELAQKDKDLDGAFKKRQFQKVTQIRNEITGLRKKLLESKSDGEECKKACRPDVVKQVECNNMVKEIVKLEESEQSNTEKVDSLYRELSKCHRDLEQLKKSAR